MDLAELINRKLRAGHGTSSNRLRSLLITMFKFAAGQGIVRYSPAAPLPKLHKETKRTRVLSGPEIARFWNGLSTVPVSDAVRLALAFQLVTGQRCGEVRKATWDDIDMRAAVWTLPPEKTKNGREHCVPLSPLALDILRVARDLPLPKRCKGQPVVLGEGESGHVFLSPMSGRVLSETAMSRALYANRDVFGPEPYSTHALRRTAATAVSKLGYPRHVIGAILNHTDNSVTARYDLNTYADEKRAALDAWGEQIERLVGIVRPDHQPGARRVASWVREPLALPPCAG